MRIKIKFRVRGEMSFKTASRHEIRTLMHKLWILGLLLLAGCTEIGPVITPLGQGNPDPGQSASRRVLVEEFSGVRCVNCPAGAQDLERLAALYPGRLVILSIHAGFFSNPYPENRYDFRTPEGNNLLNLLGQPLGYPSAVVNRRKFEGEPDLQLSRAQWAGFIAQELEQKPGVDVRISSAYSGNSRELRADVDVVRLEAGASSSDLRLSVYIVENDIADTQLTPDGKQNDYVHQHVLRKALTPFDGTPVGPDLQSASSVRRSFVFTLPEGWNPDKCKLIAFAHRSGDRWDVLQAAEKGF